jgi:hypothetical protein
LSLVGTRGTACAVPLATTTESTAASSKAAAALYRIMRTRSPCRLYCVETGSLVSDVGGGSNFDTSAGVSVSDEPATSCFTYATKLS